MVLILASGFLAPLLFLPLSFFLFFATGGAFGIRDDLFR
jgi:hypothetical protein